MDCSSLATRMKDYENETRTYLKSKKPVIIRLDGRAFHTFTRGLNKPYDEILSNTMVDTALLLSHEIQNVKFAYTQSDEISLCLLDTETENTQPYFNNNIQKICSVAASTCTIFFYKNYLRTLQKEIPLPNIDDVEDLKNLDINSYKYWQKLYDYPTFDCRCFNIPQSEIPSYFIWRWKDCKRNSIEASARSLYSAKDLLNHNSKELLQMISDKGIDWNDYPEHFKYGTYISKDEELGWRTFFDTDDFVNFYNEHIDTWLGQYRETRNE